MLSGVSTFFVCKRKNSPDSTEDWRRVFQKFYRIKEWLLGSFYGVDHIAVLIDKVHLQFFLIDAENTESFF